MLDLLPTKSEGTNIPKHMDLSSYLLSASPPTSDFSLMGYTQHSHNPIGIENLETTTRTLNINCPFHQSSFPSLIQSNRNDNRVSNINNLNRRNLPLKPIIMKSDSSSAPNVNDESEDTTLPSVSSVSQSPSSTRAKRVSFADCQGLALAHIRIVKESPDEPPELSPSVLSSLTIGANADVTSKPPIKLCFSQPASDYLAFRDKLHNNFVSLENVILRDYTVEGTIKVKNIAFEKSVFVRLSLDEWETFNDYEGVFVPGSGFGSADIFDTFSFNLEISPSFDITKKVQFAVCYSANGHEHWDNNGGQNYCILSEESDSNTLEPPAFHERYLPEKKTDSWSEFSVWRDLDSGGSPYY